MPNLTKRGDIWHYSFTVEGKRFRGSTGTTDKKLATDFAIREETRQRRVAIHGPESVITFTEAVHLYIEAGKDTRYVLAALDHFKDTLLVRITPPMIRDAAERLYPKAGSATRNRQGIAPIQAIINHAADKGLCPMVRVRRFPVPKAAPRPAGDRHWLKAFQRGARANGRPEVAALARFMFETAARIGQATALEWTDVDLTAATARLRTRKTGPGGGVWERVAHLTPAMVAELANLERHGSRIFGYRSGNTIRRAWAAAIRTAGIAKLTPHEAGRHGFATETIVRNGVDVPTAAEAGGWRSKRLMLETYAHGEGVAGMIDKVFGTTRSRGARKSR